MSVSVSTDKDGNSGEIIHNQAQEEELEFNGRQIDKADHFQEPTFPPAYSRFCKFLLVEELSLVDDYRHLHHGRCTVLGRLQRDEQGHHLENLRLQHLPKEYQLLEGACNVRLEFNAKTCSQLVKVQPGSYCEVLGEVLLMPKEANHDDHLTKSSSRYFVQTLNIIKGTSKDASEANERERKLSAFYQKYYQPVIRVWFINSVNRPTEVITRNLELRHLLAQVIVDEEEQTSSSPSSSSSRKAEA